MKNVRTLLSGALLAALAACAGEATAPEAVRLPSGPLLEEAIIVDSIAPAPPADPAEGEPEEGSVSTTETGLLGPSGG